VVEPFVDYIDELCLRKDEQIVVLIPTLMPSRLRYQFLHNHLDLVLSAALRSHPEVVVARVTLPLDDEPGGDASRPRPASRVGDPGEADAAPPPQA
jgi:hypothetical protein